MRNKLHYFLAVFSLGRFSGFPNITKNQQVFNLKSQMSFCRIKSTIKKELPVVKGFQFVKLNAYLVKSTIKNGLPAGKGFQFVKLRIGPSWLRRRCWTWSRWGWRPQPICWRAQWRSTPSLQPEINRKFNLVAKKFKNWITHIQAHFKIDILLLIRQTITWSNFTWSKLSFFTWSKFH